MKKIILFVLTLSLMLLTINLNVDAATTITSGQIDKNKEITLEIKLTEAKTVKSGAISFEYPENTVNILAGEWTISNTLLSNFDMSTELGAFAFMSATKISGTIFKITFLSRSVCDYGTYNIVAKLQLEDANGNKTTEDAKGTITIAHTHYNSLKVQTPEFLAKEATCITALTYYYKCMQCGKRADGTYTVGSPLGHTGGTATCTKQAICTRCNQSYGSLLEHKYGEWKVITETTEEKEGLKEKVCTTCNYKVTEKIPVLGHTHKYVKSAIIEATCNNKGLFEYICSCGGRYTEIVEKTTHEYSEYTILVEPTEYSVGYKQKKCSHCNDVVLEVIEKLSHSHNYNDYLFDNDEHYKKCECGEINNKTKHTFGEAVDDGENKIFTCTECGYQKYEKTVIQQVEVPIETTNNLVYIVVIAIEAVAVITFALLFILKKKNNI